MDLEFRSAELAKLCNKERFAKKMLGQAGAKKLVRRLADLAAADNVSELAAGRPHPLVGDRVGQFAVSLDKGRRLVFEPRDHPPPRKDNGGIDWASIRAIRIVEIGDYHD